MKDLLPSSLRFHGHNYLIVNLVYLILYPIQKDYADKKAFHILFCLAGIAAFDGAGCGC